MYVKCPRCQLNYINQETEQYCKVCLVDMGKIQGQPELELEEEYKLCPECGENYLEEGEEYCYACRLEHMKHEGKEDEEVYVDPEDMLPDTVEDSLDAMAELENESEAEQEEAEAEE